MSNTLYRTDFHAWLGEQAKLLRAGDVAGLDLENLAEEIEASGGSQRRELRSRLRVLILHLLKWQVQAEHRHRSWKSTIDSQRDEIDDLLDQNPSLGQTVPDTIRLVYPKAIRKALEETGLIDDPFPSECPFAAEQVLDHAFLSAI
jgi:hypothetical protein